MRVAALYDIHGNLPALRAVLADLERERVDSLVIGGDVVPGPLPGQTLDVLLALDGDIRWVRGNGDREAVAAYDRGASAIDIKRDPAEDHAEFTASLIGRRHRDLLASFEELVSLELDGLGPTLFCHGSPRSDGEMLTTATSDERLRAILQAAAPVEPVIVCGHTHRQFDRRVDGWRIVNAGAVGLPYEGRAGAFWALLGPDVDLRCTEYPLDDALAEMRAGGLPDVDELLGESLVEPADPDFVARYFERQALDLR